jgi:hypothetical protein
VYLTYGGDAIAGKPTPTLIGFLRCRSALLRG